MKYFEDDPARRCAVTLFAREQGDELLYVDDGMEAGWWWLRSPGDDQRGAALVLEDGSLCLDYVSSGRGVVRPAFWINLESGIF